MQTALMVMVKLLVEKCMCVCAGKSKLSHLAHASHRDAAESSEHVGLDTRRRLEHKDTTGTKQIHWNLAGKHSNETLTSEKEKELWGWKLGLIYSCAITDVFIIKILKCEVVYLGVDLHCQEKPEAGMRLHGVELLLQLHQPSGGQVDVL